MTPLWRFFDYWLSTATRDREIVDAVVAPAHRGPSAELLESLRHWPGVHYWVEGDTAGRLMLARSLGRVTRERWWLHGALFAATFLTVWLAGSVLAGADPHLPAISLAHLGRTARGMLDWFAGWRPGLEFAMGLMAILLAHESGHYLTAKRYGINASPPYFLPAPPVLNFVGTFGAFIRLRSPVADRQQLLDVGAAGPWAGFVVAVIVLAVGMLASHPVAPVDAISPQMVIVGRTTIYLGDSLLMAGVRHLFMGGGVVLLHPLAFAGWLGVLVTMLNLLPLGQLDGGHVLYALLGRRQAWLGVAAWLALLVLGHWFWGWWVWAFFTLLLGRGSLAHPTVLDRHRPVPPSHRPFGWATVLLFVLTFTTVPFYV